MDPETSVTVGNFNDVFGIWIRNHIVGIIATGLVGTVAVGTILYFAVLNVIEGRVQSSSLNAKIEVATQDAEKAKKALDRIEVILNPADELLKEHGVEELERAISSIEKMVSTKEVSLPGDIDAQNNKHGTSISLEPVSANNPNETLSSKCPPGSFAVGIDFKLAGTCENKCAGDAPVIKSITLHCATI